jgi:hypothetical protein
MRLKKFAGNVAGAVILGLMIASCATDDGRDVQVRDSQSTAPAKVSPEERLEQQRQLEERQRDQRQQDRRQQNLERAQQETEPPMSSMHASSNTKAPIVVTDSTPSPQERGNSVNGELLRIEGEYFIIRDASGQEMRLHVTNETKMENAVQVGDRIEAQVSGRNHAETVRSVVKPKGN